MITGIKRFFRHNSEGGQGLVEFAMVLPIFLLIIFTIIDFSWIEYQKSSFNYGYLKAGCEIQAKDLGDMDSLESVPSKSTYTGTTVADQIKNTIIKSNNGILDENLKIKEAEAVLYNKTEDFNIPNRNHGVGLGNSVTRYMDLTAKLEYNISPITFVGKMFIEDSLKIEKSLEKTNIVKSHHRT